VAGEGLLPSGDFLLDTGIVIRHLRNDNRAHDLLGFLENIGRINVSVITYLEILLGCQPHEAESTKLLFERLPPIAVSQEIAHKAASLIKKYPNVFGKQIGRGTPDALITATAWQTQSKLVTLNTRQFAKIPIVEVNIWAIKQTAKDWTGQLKL
jgi:predicted nucleic acid-binding protein